MAKRLKDEIILLGSGAIFRHYLHSSLSPLVQDWFFSLLSFSSLGCWSVVLCGKKNKGYVSLRLTIGAVTRFDNFVDSISFHLVS